MKTTRVVLIIACLFVFSSMSMAATSDSFCWPFNDKLYELKRMPSAELPVLRGHVRNEDTMNVAECYDLLRGRDDMVTADYDRTTTMFTCTAFNLNATGTDVPDLSKSFLKEDKLIDWMSKPDFNLTDAVASPYYMKVTGMTTNAILVDGSSKTSINLGDFSGSCLGDLEKCSKGVAFSLWMKVNNIDENRLVWYLASSGRSESSTGVALNSEGTHAFWSFKTSSQQWRESVPFEIDLGRWQHLIATWSEQEGAQIYVNGLLIDSVDDGIAYAAGQVNNKDFIIGDTGPTTFTVDDFLIYYRHVDEDEAKQLFLDRLFGSRQGTFQQWKTPEFDLANDAELPRTTKGMYTTKAIAFNGVDNSLSLGNLRTSCFGNIDHCDNGITYNLWLKVANVQNKDPSQTAYYLSSGAQSRWSMGVALYSRQGMMSWSFKTSTQWWRKENQFSVKYDEWQHVVATWSHSKGVVVYKDGVKVKSFSYAMNMGNNGRHNDFVLGRPNHLNEDGPWNGEFVIENLRAYYTVMDGEDCASTLKLLPKYGM